MVREDEGDGDVRERRSRVKRGMQGRKREEKDERGEIKREKKRVS